MLYHIVQDRAGSTSIALFVGTHIHCARQEIQELKKLL